MSTLYSIFLFFSIKAVPCENVAFKSYYLKNRTLFRWERMSLHMTIVWHGSTI